MKTTVVLVVITILAAVLLAGCSGSGIKAAKVEGATVQTLSADHLSAVQLFFGWLGVLYQRLPTDWPAPDLVEPDMTYDKPGFGPHTLHIRQPLTDGGVSEFWAADYGAGQSEGTITWGGETYSWAADAVIWSPDGLTATNHCVNTYPNGATIDTVIVDDFTDPSGLYHGSWVGTARLTSGASMRFTVDRRDLDRDELRLELPDGSVMTLRIPIGNSTPSPYWPRFGDGAIGTFAAPGRGTSQIQIAGQAQPNGEGAWNQWTFTAENGMAGTFALAPNSAGTGQWQQGPETLGALRWTEAGLGALDLLGAATEEVTPSAAARDFRMDNWVRNAACLGPAPMY